MPQNFVERIFNITKPQKEPEFVSFWSGAIDGITYGCLASFPYWGARLRLYSYDDNLAVPPGIELADAREICADESLVSRYIADGRVESAKFANFFRYLLLQKTSACWVDCDLFCLKQPNFQNDRLVFGQQFPDREHPWSINNAVLKLPSDSPVLVQLTEQARAVVDLDQHWGVIGPELVTRLFKETGLLELARPVTDFYPLPPDKFWMPLLPDETKVVEALVSTSILLHLWHNQFKRSGYDKTSAPPPGSYLHEAFSRVGGLAGFSRTYDVDQCKNDIGDWLPPEKAWSNDHARTRIQEIKRDIANLRDTNRFLLDVISTEPIEGELHTITERAWKWVSGSTITFGSDGVIRNDGRREGVWRCLTIRANTIILIWDDGGWLDFCRYDDAVLKCRNNAGHSFDVIEA